MESQQKVPAAPPITQKSGLHQGVWTAQGGKIRVCFAGAVRRVRDMFVLAGLRWLSMACCRAMASMDNYQSKPRLETSSEPASSAVRGALVDDVLRADEHALVAVLPKVLRQPALSSRSRRSKSQ